MEPIKLKKLLKNLPIDTVKGSKEIEIKGLSSDSRRVAPGDLFIAKQGKTHHAARFIPDAVASGAVAILTDLYDPFHPDIVQIIHPDVSKIEALLAREYYDHADQRLFLIGVTGTNGKTTTTQMIYHALRQLEGETGLIGTIECLLGGGRAIPSEHTTPDILTNYKFFHEMVSLGCKSCVMEVSSHALDQGRVAPIEFDTAVFTNLTQDHLDYHGNMDQYAEAKAQLFTMLSPQGSKPFIKTAVVNGDDPYEKQILTHCSAKIIRYGLDPSADLYATDLSLSASGLSFTIHYAERKYPFSTSLIGRYNVYNLLAAIGALLTRGYSLEKILPALETFHTTSGRLERVKNKKNLNLFVDYAHTEDALHNVLITLRELNPKRLITLFGCGGDRDQTKRPKMGAVAEKLSDLIIVTNDNPRQEDPDAIIRGILSGIQDLSRVLVLPDREEAIHRAIQLAAPEDIVLIAGKGHETYQIFSQRRIAFDDRCIAQAAAE